MQDRGAQKRKAGCKVARGKQGDTQRVCDGSFMEILSPCSMQMNEERRLDKSKSIRSDGRDGERTSKKMKGTNTD